MKREALLRTKEYWLTKTQIELFAEVESYIKSKKLNREKFANQIGVTKGYVSQVLNGDYDHRISKFFELALAIGKIPIIEFVDLEQFIKKDAQSDFGAVYHRKAFNQHQPIIVKLDKCSEVSLSIDDGISFRFESQSTQKYKVN